MTCPQKKIFLVTSLLWFVFSSAYSQEKPDKAPITRLLNSISDFSFYLYRDYYREFITDLGDLIYLPKKQTPNPSILCSQPFYQNSHQQMIIRHITVVQLIAWLLLFGIQILTSVYAKEQCNMVQEEIEYKQLAAITDKALYEFRGLFMQNSQ